MRDARGFRLKELEAPFAELRGELLARGGRDAPTPDLGFLREAARATYRAAERMASLADAESPVNYPGGGLSQRLRLVARLITGGFGTRLFHVALDGFDTHSAQGPTHAALLAELGGALRAFQRDLEHHGAARRVTTFVFSEFGRRVRENGSKGTDHGAGAPCFLVGGALRGGLLGTPPDLERLEEGDVPHGTDFRSLYTALERDWMGLSPSTGSSAAPLFA